MPTPPLRLAFLDLEMTGLDPDSCSILEVAVIITGADLVPLAQYEQVVWQPEEVLARAEPVVRDMHTRSGLFAAVRASSFSLPMVEREVMKLLTQHCPLGDGVLTGNSIHTDRKFLVRHMPMVERYLHHRMVDVSSLRVLAQAWRPEPLAPTGPAGHRAMADLRGCLAEIGRYRAALFGS